jgi:hypothetical protein
MATAVTLEGCAELRAEMEAGHLRDEVLVRVGLGVDDWTAAQTEWLAKMGAEIERGRFELTNRYSQAFLERQRALRALREGAIHSPGAPTAPAAAVVPAPTGPSSPAVAPEVPSFLLPVSPPIPAPIAPSPPAREKPRAPSNLGGTSMGFIVPKGAALPFAKAPAPAAAAAGAPTRPMAPMFAAPAGTAAGLPFDPQPPTTSDPLGETTTALPTRSPFAPALPFAASPAPGAVPAAATPAPPPVAAKAAAKAAPPPDRDPMDMTTMGAISPFARVMPFGPAPAAAAAAAAAPAAAPAKAPPLPGRAPPLPARAPPLPPNAAPAPAAAPVIIGGYTLEQHVSLCADLTFTPERAAQTLARYRITIEGKAELDRLWKERFAADPPLEARWREAHGMYLKFLGSRRA